MGLLETLLERRSPPSRSLSEPGPNEAQLHSLLTLAVHVPDHGKLTPWRFIHMKGEAKARFGMALVERFRELNPQASPAQIEKERDRFRHAPVVLCVVGCLTNGHKVPVQEQLLSGGAVCFSLLQGAHALGFAAQWLTGWAAYDDQLKQRLDLSENEQILGFIHIGTASQEAPERLRPDVAVLLRELA